MPGKPNILFLLSDEHSFRFMNHLPRERGGERVDTPTLDRLARQATVFEHAYCPVPLCVPSRMCLMTGLWADECGAIDNGSILAPTFDTMPKMLARAGYETALVGKMHFRGSNQFHGFHHRPYGDLVGSGLHQWEERAFLSPEELAAAAPARKANAHGISDDLAGRTANAGRTRIPESLICDRMVAEESVAFLRDFAAAGGERPWFLCASFSRPHFPMTTPRRFIDKVGRTGVTEPFTGKAGASYDHPVSALIRQGFETERIDHGEMMNGRAGYFACISYLDEIIGDMLLRLERDGLLDNTIIVYSSDHGEMAGELGTWWKSGWYEGCCRVPLLVSTPAQRQGRQPARVVDTPVSTIDLAPTFAALGGGAPQGRISGIDLSPSITGDAAVAERPVFCDHLSKRWGKGAEFRAIRLAKWKYVAFRGYDDLLFDATSDLHESENLIASAPEPVLAELRRCVLDYDRLDVSLGKQQAELRERYPLTAPNSTPSQFLLPDGKLAAADVTIYKPTILTSDPSGFFTDWPDPKAREVYRFGNGIVLRRSHMLDIQVERYGKDGNPNLHEPVEEEWLLKTFADSLPDRPVFVDVGAAVGYYSVLVKKTWPSASVYAVEPLPRHIEALADTLALNGLQPADITLLPVAVSRSNGSATLVGEDYGARLAGRKEAKGKVQVATRKLETLLADLPSVHMLKMDIQGVELDVFQSSERVLCRGRIRHFVVGTHGADIHRQVGEILERCGYRIVLDDPAPPMQPDGLIVATFANRWKAMTRRARAHITRIAGRS